MSEAEPLVDVEGGLNERKKGALRLHVERLFAQETNPKFAQRAEHAFRGACALVFFAIPLMVPEGLVGPRDYLIHLGIYNSGVCLFIIFNLGTTFGHAFDACKSGLQGNLLAAILGWIMYTIYPDGVQPDLPNEAAAWWGGVTVGALFVSALLCLRISVSMQMFALSNFAGTWMNFLDTSKAANIVPPWSSGWSLRHDALSQSFACTGIGMVAVMLASLLPYPRFSLNFVTENQLHCTPEVMRVMNTIVNFYALDKPNKYTKDKVIRRLTRLKALSHDNKPLLQAAWWETFLHSSKVKRRVLAQMDKTSTAIVDIVWNAWQETVAEDFGEKDGKLIREMKALLEKLLMSMEVTLNLVVRAAEDGSLSKSEMEALEESIKRTEANEEELSVKFRATRKVLTDGKPESIYKDVRVAHVLLYSLSEACGKTKELAQKVETAMKPQGGVLDLSILHDPPHLGSFAGLFSDLFEKAHVIYASRGLIAFFAPFVFGYLGFKHIYPPYSAGIAGTSPFLLTMYVGSALVSDLNRIQGLMLGYVMAPILSSLTLTCSILDITIHLVITWLWVFIGVFVRESSNTFSSIGSMAAAFGASTLLAHNCSEYKVNKAGIFESLALNCMAVIITTLVNLAIPSERAADMSVKHLLECWQIIKKSLTDLFDPNQTTVAFRASEAAAALEKAKTLGEEAAFEPRLWRTNWKTALFDKVVEDTAAMVATLSAMEHAIGGTDGGAKRASLLELMQIPIFRTSTEGVVLRKMEVCIKLLGIFKHESAKPWPVLRDADVYETLEAEELRLEESFVKEDLPKLFSSDKDRETKSVRACEMAAIATTLANLNRIKKQLRLVQHEILRHSYDDQ